MLLTNLVSAAAVMLQSHNFTHIKHKRYTQLIQPEVPFYSLVSEDQCNL